MPVLRKRQVRLALLILAAAVFAVSVATTAHSDAGSLRPGDPTPDFSDQPQTAPDHGPDRAGDETDDR